MIIAGIDCGAKNTKTVILKDGNIVGKGMILTGFDQVSAIKGSLDAVNEIRAMAKAANYLFPSARTVTDVGAEMGRAAKIDEKTGGYGPNGHSVR